MKPYTKAEAEADMTAALVAGDTPAALLAAEVLDRMPAHGPPSLAASALWYAEHGLWVFPLAARSKVPRPRSRGLKDASCDVDWIRYCWRSWPEANIGLATGHGVDVIDFDGPRAHALWGQEFPGSWAEHGVEVLATVSTPRPGGLHVYVPATGKGNRTRLLGHPGIDYRGLGGYVVAPPSVTEHGRYEFLRHGGLG